jgi:hypothetical protein
LGGIEKERTIGDIKGFCRQGLDKYSEIEKKFKKKKKKAQI